MSEVNQFFSDRIPDDWFESDIEVISDRDEILITGKLTDPNADGDSSEDAVNLARAQAINEFREATRDKRMTIADKAETLFGRKVSWGAGVGDQHVLFTHLGVPVMSRLRLPEREALDTLVTAGVARNRSDALAWCVKFVRKDQADWLKELQTAFTEVEKVRSSGPNI
jgi:hypothetical protein